MQAIFIYNMFNLEYPKLSVMKFLSFAKIYNSAVSSFKRFYLPLLIAVAGAIFSIALIESTRSDNRTLISLIYTSVLAMNFSFGCMLYAERRQKSISRVLMPAVSLSAAFLYWFFASPESIFEDYKSTLVFFTLFIVVHLWVAIAAYVGVDEKKGFWHFNEALFLRIITGGIFSVVIYAGLALAIAALHSLFNFDINDRMFADLWVVVAAIFNTWFFLSGVPQNYGVLNNIDSFPKGLKIFVQYILIPLAIIYMVILYAYSIKIVVEWTLPEGWVSMLILCYAVVGILAILLAYPLRDDSDNTWVRLYSRFFFVGLLPLIVLLFIAIWVRINEYGITELRYYVLLLGIWLFFMAFYFIFSKSKNIKLVPATLIIMAVLSLFGPWGVFSVSQASQAARFDKLMLKTKIWQANKGFIVVDSISREDEEQLTSIVDFFVERRVEKKLQPFFDVNMDSLVTSAAKNLKEDEFGDNYHYRSWVLKDKIKDSLYTLMHLDRMRTDFVVSAPEGAVNYNARSNRFTDIKGYKAAWEYAYFNSETHSLETVYLSSTDSIMITVANTPASFTMVIHEQGKTDSMSFSSLLDYVEEERMASDTLATERMVVNSKSGKYKLVLKTFHLVGKDFRDDACVNNFEGLLLVK